MDNQENNNWLDELLGTAPAPTEIGADEKAVQDAGLIHPNDLELEKILAENWSGTAPVPADPVPMQQPPQEAITEDELFQAVAIEPAAPEYIPEETPAVEETPKKRKAPAIDPYAPIRPKKPKSYAFFGVPHLISTVIWILLIVIVGLSLGRTLWVVCAEVMAFGKEDHQVTISLSKDDAVDMDIVAEKLSNAGLIEYPQLFKSFASMTGKSDNIASGTYTLNAKLDYNAMINAMSASTSREVVEVMFPEGYTCAQIFLLLEEKGVCTVADMEAFLESYDPDEGDLDEYWFCEGIQWGDKYSLEGYLAPDTYEFYTNDDPERILTKFLDEFDDRFTNIMKEDFEDIQYKFMEALYEEGYSSQYIQENKLTVHDVLTLASIVQKETGSSSESFDIASVFYNRLSTGMELGSDATVYYAIGDYLLEHGELTKTDLEKDSPYNTRKNRGLPPGPICNPGTYALYAALDPNDTDFMYFVYDSDAREHLFSETLAEHERKCKELGLW